MEISTETKKKIDSTFLKRSICPITKHIMNEPVIALAHYIVLGIKEERGYTFEKEAIESLFDKAHKEGNKTVSVTINREEIQFLVPEKDKLYAYNKHLWVNETKKKEIAKLLADYPKFYDTNCVYLPRAWQRELNFYIKESQDAENIEEHIQAIKTLLAQDRRLLTVKLDGKYSAFYLSCAYGTPELVWCFLQRLKVLNQIETIKSEWHENIQLKYANDLLRLLLLGRIGGVEKDFHRLLSLGACCIQKDAITNNNLLHDLIIEGAGNIDWLINCKGIPKGKLVKAQNKEGATPLHLGIQCNRTDIVKSLLPYADINLKNNAGDTVLHLAVQYQNTELVKILLEAGDLVEIKNNLFYTAISIECQKILYTENWQKTLILSLLVGEKADLLPLHLALEIGDLNLLETLLRISKNYLESKDNNNLTPLYLAVIKNNLEATKILVASGTILTKQIADTGETILHAAVKLNNNFILEYLFEDNPEIIGKIVNLQDENGNTALHFAAECDNKQAISMLMDCGAILKDNYNGKAPKAMTKNPDTKKFLKKKIKYLDKQDLVKMKELVLQQQKQITQLRGAFSPEPSVIFSDITVGSPVNQRHKYSEAWCRVLSNGYLAVYIDEIININFQDEVIHTLSEVNKSPTCVLITKNGNLVCVDNEEKIHIWQLKNKYNSSNQHMMTLTGHKNTIDFVQELYRGKLASFAIDGEIKIWDATGLCIHTIPQTHLEIQCFDINKDDTKLAGGSADGLIYLWSLGPRPEWEAFVVENNLSKDNLMNYLAPPVRCIKIIKPDLLAAGLGGNIIIFNMENKTEIHRLTHTDVIKHNTAGIKSIGLYYDEFYQDYKMVTCCGEKIKIWNLEDFSCVYTFESDADKTFHLFTHNNINTLVIQKGNLTKVINLNIFLENKRKDLHASLAWW